MGWQDFIAVAVVTVAVGYAGRSFWRTLRGKSGCGGGCSCSAGEDASAPSRRIKRVPLVGVDEIGRPPVPPIKGDAT